MTYRAGLGFRMADLGLRPSAPHVLCDGCGLRISAETKAGLPTQWLLKLKAPPGWKMVRNENAAGSVFRRDYCPRCAVCLISSANGVTPSAKP